MIAPKTQKPTAREESLAYELATLRDGDQCVMRAAGCSGPTQRDHRKNRSQGGLTVASNLQCLCLKHHDWKTNNPFAAVAKGWAVPGHGDPARWPARRWFKGDFGVMTIGWVLYDNDGHVLEISEDEAADRMTNPDKYRKEVS